MYQLHIRKESLKFASAHMTVFPDGSKEALHGHNYSVSISFFLNDISIEKMVPFSLIKTRIKELCEKWDEKVLIARLCPFFELTSHSSKESEFVLCGKRYVLPSDEVIFLDLDNITVESLAGELSRVLSSSLPNEIAERIHSVEIRVDESAGQGASCRMEHGGTQ